MPVDEQGLKWACENCIRGHRAKECDHWDRYMLLVKKPGRPLQDCPHPKRTACACNQSKVKAVMIKIMKDGKCLCRPQSIIRDPPPAHALPPPATNVQYPEMIPDHAYPHPGFPHPMYHNYHTAHIQQTSQAMAPHAAHSVYEYNHLLAQHHIPQHSHLNDTSLQPHNQQSQQYSSQSPAHHFQMSLPPGFSSSVTVHPQQMQYQAPQQGQAQYQPPQPMPHQVMIPHQTADPYMDAQQISQPYFGPHPIQQHAVQPVNDQEVKHETNPSQMMQEMPQTTMFHLPSHLATSDNPMNASQMAGVLDSNPDYVQSVPVHAEAGIAGTAAASVEGHTGGCGGGTTPHICNCGPSCTCIGCAAHPHNPAMTEHLNELGGIMFEDGLFEDNGSRPQSFCEDFDSPSAEGQYSQQTGGTQQYEPGSSMVPSQAEHNTMRHAYADQASQHPCHTTPGLMTSSHGHIDPPPPNTFLQFEYCLGGPNAGCFCSTGCQCEGCIHHIGHMQTLASVFGEA